MNIQKGPPNIQQAAAHTREAANIVHLVVPDGIDDPHRPSGGNIYDRRVRDGLAAAGWRVHEHPVTGFWATPGRSALDGLAAVLDAVPDGATVLVDGLISTPGRDVMLAEADRLRLVVLVHMPTGGEAERAVLSAAAAVVATSETTRARLLDAYELPVDRVHAAAPGVDPAEVADGTTAGGGLLCVAAVAPHKGHDVLLAALATLADLPWRCLCVGRLDREPDFVARLRRKAGDRVLFTGPLAGAELAAAYAAADLLVLPSLAESYGMVVTEALAHGLPVLASRVGGIPEALGRGAGGSLPGRLVPPDDPAALAAALRDWLTDAHLRDRLRRAALERRATLTGWSETVDRLATALTAAATIGAPA